MWFRVVKEFEHIDQRGRQQHVHPGELVDILNKHDVRKLLLTGHVCPKQQSHKHEYSLPAEPHAPTKRIGIWLKTSAGYSGGRIHMYQYAWCLAASGAEVWLITQAMPRWREDYPLQPRLHICILPDGKIPPDLDVIVTDSKAAVGQQALEYKVAHPQIPLICWSFETSNWIQQFYPKYAERLRGNEIDYRHIFEAADLLIANSDESRKWLMQWMGNGTESAVIPPAMNDHALKQHQRPQKRPNRRFAFWVGRGTDYKQSGLAAAAIWALPMPFDLVVFGGPTNMKPDTPLHKLYRYGFAPDVEKFALMQDAHMVLAPSLFEGFGMVPGEALAAGTPCVVFDLPVLRGAYGDRLEYAKYKDNADFKTHVSQLAEQPKKDMGLEQRWVLDRYGLSAMQDHIDTVPYHAVRRVSVTAQMICYSTPTAISALEAIYPYVDEIRIAYGPTELWKAYPEDGTLAQLREYPDPDHKITLQAQEVWPDKCVMRQWCSEKAKGNYMMMLDADEIWTGLDNWLVDPPKWGNPRWVNFWHDGKHWVHDGDGATTHWGHRLDPHGSVLPHYRWSWWRNSYYWLRHHTSVDAQKQSLVSHADHEAAAVQVPECLVYHLGHCMPDAHMKQKHEFYLRRDGDDETRRSRMAAWQKWDGSCGDCGDGIVEDVTWDLPEAVVKALDTIGGI